MPQVMPHVTKYVTADTLVDGDGTEVALLDDR